MAAPQTLYQSACTHHNAGRYNQAYPLYRRAAEQGYADAQNMLGDMYRIGRGVRQDYAEALKWFRKAADKGHPSAQNCIGEMYWSGQGVRQNRPAKASVISHMA